MSIKLDEHWQVRPTVLRRATQSLWEISGVEVMIAVFFFLEGFLFDVPSGISSFWDSTSAVLSGHRAKNSLFIWIQNKGSIFNSWAFENSARWLSRNISWTGVAHGKVGIWNYIYFESRCQIEQAYCGWVKILPILWVTLNSHGIANFSKIQPLTPASLSATVNSDKLCSSTSWSKDKPQSSLPSYPFPKPIFSQKRLSWIPSMMPPRLALPWLPLACFCQVWFGQWWSLSGLLGFK